MLVGSLGDWHRERQFRILNERKKERCVKVIRSSVECVIDVKELLVGDIALLEPGEVVPCDGVFISGHNIECDESSATGKPDIIKKAGYDECIILKEKAKRAGPHTRGFNNSNAHTDCFVVSRSKVLQGHAKYVVIAVGQMSLSGRIMMGMFLWWFLADLWTLIAPLVLQLPEETLIPSLCRRS